MISIGDKIKEVRVGLNKSQTEFAKELNLSRSGVTQIESGKTNPSFEVINKIVSIYGIPPEFFFNSHDKDKIISDTPPARGLTENDLSVLKSMNFIHYIDNIVLYINNSDSKNRSVLREVKKLFREKITTLNKIVEIANVLRVDHYHPSAKEYQEFIHEEWEKGIISEADPEEYSEKLRFDATGLKYIIQIVRFNEDIEHIQYLIDQRISTLLSDCSFMVRVGMIKFVENIDHE